MAAAERQTNAPELLHLCHALPILPYLARRLSWPPSRAGCWDRYRHIPPIATLGFCLHHVAMRRLPIIQNVPSLQTCERRVGSSPMSLNGLLTTLCSILGLHYRHDARCWAILRGVVLQVCRRTGASIPAPFPRPGHHIATAHCLHGSNCNPLMSVPNPIQLCALHRILPVPSRVNPCPLTAWTLTLRVLK